MTLLYKPEKKQLSIDDNFSLYSIVIGIEQFSTSDENYYFEQKGEGQKKFSKDDNYAHIGEIYSKATLRNVLRHFLRCRSSSVPIILSRSPDLEPASVYRAVARLQEMGLIRPSTHIRTRPADKKCRKRTTIFSLHNAAPEDIVQAIELQKRLSNPLYQYGEKASQIILAEYLQPRKRDEIRWGDIRDIVKERFPRTREYASIADLATSILIKQGIKVSR